MFLNNHFMLDYMRITCHQMIKINIMNVLMGFHQVEWGLLDFQPL